MNGIEDGDNQIIEFDLDPLLLDLKIVKQIGIEKSSNAIIIESCNHTILQTIRMDSFTKETIKPLKKQLDEILTDLQNDDKIKTINSIITCINKNVNKILEYSSQDLSENSEKEEAYITTEKLVDLALNPDTVEKLFKDQYGKLYATVRIGPDRQLETLSITSIKYKRYLSKLFRDHYDLCFSDGILNTVITHIASQAEFNGEVIPLHLRVAWGSEVNRCRDHCVYYDICDSKRRIIEISKDGWRMMGGDDSNIPILFRKYNQQPQVEPDRNYPSDILDQLLNLTNVKNPRHKHLLKVYIISTVIPDIDHVILTTYGPKGAAKSFLLELIKKLIDPSKPVLLTLHRNNGEFIQQVNHNYINYYDNVKFVPNWLSDEICKAVTGIGHTKRQLFTDDEDIVYEHKRCLGLNGINVALTESDALDRILSIELEEIDEEDRRKEEDLWGDFDRIRPHVFGYILDIIVRAMQIKPALDLKKLPRMADWTEWGEAISRAMGYTANSFIEAYAENRNEQNTVAVNENLVGFLITKYIQDIESQFSLVDKIYYEPQELYKNLIDFAENNNIRIDSRQFPKDSSSFVKKLRTVIPNLKAGYGIIIEIGRSSDNTSVITIFRKTTVTDKNKDKPSAGGSEPPEEENTVSTKSENNENNENSHIGDDIKEFDSHNNDIDSVQGAEENNV